METMMGTLQLFSFNFAPLGWASCDGQVLPISSNEPLYSIIGNRFGGDGATTFALPNLNNAEPLIPGNNFMKYYIATEGYYPIKS